MEPRGPTSMPRSLSSPVAAISTVSSSRRRVSTVASHAVLGAADRRGRSGRSRPAPRASFPRPCQLSPSLRCSADGAFSAGTAPGWSRSATLLRISAPAPAPAGGGLGAVAAAAGRAAGAGALPRPGPVARAVAAARRAVAVAVGRRPRARRRFRCGDARRCPTISSSTRARAAAARALALAGPAAPAGALPLGPGADRTDPGPHPGLDPHAAEEARLGLAHDDDLGVVDGHAQLVERLLGRLFDGLACDLYPLHVLACLSGPLRTRAVRVRLRAPASPLVAPLLPVGGPSCPAAGLPARSRAVLGRPLASAFWSAAAFPWPAPSRPSRSSASSPAWAAGLLGWAAGLSCLPEPISRSTADGLHHPRLEHHLLGPDPHGRRDHHVNGCSGRHSKVNEHRR